MGLGVLGCQALLGVCRTYGTGGNRGRRGQHLQAMEHAGAVPGRLRHSAQLAGRAPCAVRTTAVLQRRTSALTATATHPALLLCHPPTPRLLTSHPWTPTSRPPTPTPHRFPPLHPQAGPRWLPTCACATSCCG